MCKICGKPTVIQDIKTFDGMIKVARCQNERGDGHPKIVYVPMAGETK